MKTIRIFLMAAALSLASVPAYAQLGGLLNKAKSTVNKVKTDVNRVKKDVEDVSKRVNGDVDFTLGANHKGIYRARTRQIILDDLHQGGDREGRKTYFTVEDNGDIVADNGVKVGEIVADGSVNCRDTSPYLTMVANGDVMMDGDVIGNIDDNGNVTMLGSSIGKAPTVPKQIAAYIFFGICNDKASIKTLRAEIEKREAERARQAALAKERAAAQAAANKSTGKSTPKSNSSSNTSAKVTEYRIEKGSARGYVDANGVVYDGSHKKIGQLPKGSGDIKDGNGSTIGSIWSGDIKDRSGNLLCTVSSGGSIAVKGSNATVAEVHAGGRVDWSKDSKTIGYCDCHNYTWTAAIIFCNLFKF